MSEWPTLKQSLQLLSISFRFLSCWFTGREKWMVWEVNGWSNDDFSFWTGCSQHFVCSSSISFGRLDGIVFDSNLIWPYNKCQVCFLYRSCISIFYFHLYFQFLFSYLNLHIGSKVGKKQKKEKRDNKIERVLTSVWTSASHHIANVNQNIYCFHLKLLFILCFALSSFIYACISGICHHIAPFETVGRLHKRRQYEKFQNKAVTRRHASF